MPPCTAHAGVVLRASSARLAARPLPTCKQHGTVGGGEGSIIGTGTVSMALQHGSIAAPMVERRERDQQRLQECQHVPTVQARQTQQQWPTVNTAGALSGSQRRGAGCAFAKHTPRAAVEAAAASSRVLLGESSSNSSPSLPAVHKVAVRQGHREARLHAAVATAVRPAGRQAYRASALTGTLSSIT